MKGLSDVRRSLLANFDLSYESLSATARRRYRHLAAFAESGFRTVAAAALWQVDEVEARDALDELWNDSLAQRDGRKGWWKLHDLLYEYAALQLAESNDEKPARVAHAEWVIELFEQNYTVQVEKFDDINAELENLRAAASWALLQKDSRLLARLATTPRNWLLNVYRQWDLWAGWLNAALSFGIEDRQLKANVLKAIGDVQQFRKDMEAALASYGEALGLFRAVGDRLGEANVLMSLGDMAVGQEAWPDAISYYEQALPFYRAIDARLGIANTLIDLGRAYFETGQRENGIACEEESAQLYSSIGLDDWAKRALGYLAKMQS